MFKDIWGKNLILNTNNLRDGIEDDSFFKKQLHYISLLSIILFFCLSMKLETLYEAYMYMLT